MATDAKSTDVTSPLSPTKSLTTAQPKKQSKAKLKAGQPTAGPTGQTPTTTVRPELADATVNPPHDETVKSDAKSTITTLGNTSGTASRSVVDDQSDDAQTEYHGTPPKKLPGTTHDADLATELRLRAEIENASLRQLELIAQIQAHQTAAEDRQTAALDKIVTTQTGLMNKMLDAQQAAAKRQDDLFNKLQATQQRVEGIAQATLDAVKHSANLHQASFDAFTKLHRPASATQSPTVESTSPSLPASPPVQVEVFLDRHLDSTTQNVDASASTQTVVNVKTEPRANVVVPATPTNLNSTTETMSPSTRPPPAATVSGPVEWRQPKRATTEPRFADRLSSTPMTGTLPVDDIGRLSSPRIFAGNEARLTASFRETLNEAIRDRIRPVRERVPLRGISHLNLKALSPQMPKYDGSNDVGKFLRWVSKLQTYFLVMQYVGPDLDSLRQSVLALCLEDRAFEWYSQNLQSSMDPSQDSLETRILLIASHFVTTSSALTAKDDFLKVKYDAETGIRDFVNRLSQHPYRLFRELTEETLLERITEAIPRGMYSDIVRFDKLSTTMSKPDDWVTAIETCERSEKERVVTEARRDRFYRRTGGAIPDSKDSDDESDSGSSDGEVDDDDLDPDPDESNENEVTVAAVRLEVPAGRQSGTTSLKHAAGKTHGHQPLRGRGATHPNSG